MNTQRLALVLSSLALLLSLVNLVVLLSALSHIGPPAVSGVAPVLRAREIQLVDGHGRMRAQIVVLPPSTVGGQSYPETVLLRLIDQNGRPGVKIGTSTEGSGLGLAGDSQSQDWSGLQLLADTPSSRIILTDRDGSVETLQP